MARGHSLIPKPALATRWAVEHIAPNRHERRCWATLLRQAKKRRRRS